VDNLEGQEKKISFFNETRAQLAARFFSIVLTALISALITFLQSIVIEPASGVPASEQITQASAVGATLRATVEFIKINRHT
jgi:hypothetical protein